MIFLPMFGTTPQLLKSPVGDIARVNDLVLVTRNVSDFADFDGLTLENWLV
jgi:tRNA(fMet)-specific endonuclease VapC